MAFFIRKKSLVNNNHEGYGLKCANRDHVGHFLSSDQQNYHHECKRRRCAERQVVTAIKHTVGFLT